MEFVYITICLLGILLAGYGFYLAELPEKEDSNKKLVGSILMLTGVCLAVLFTLLAGCPRFFTGQ